MDTARRALQRFLFVLVAVWLMSAATAVLRYLDIDGASWYGHPLFYSSFSLK
jgi:hypothetical protein